MPEDAPDATGDTMLDEQRAGSASGGDHVGLVDVDPEHYELEGELASGGMGVVLRARDRRVGREVALKELLAQSPKARMRFEREARITAQLQHPSIVPVYEVGCWPDGRPFYSMKLVAGRPLDAVVDEALDDEARLALVPRILPAVEAIAYAHEKGVIHRDLKPANVLLGEFGETVVIDWGLARGIDEADDAPTSVHEVTNPDGTTSGAESVGSGGSSGVSVEAARSGGKLTLEGDVVGTPAYMPPEQARGERLDARADVYSLGALLYHALCGDAPYDGPNVRAILIDVLTEPAPPLSERAPNAPPDLVSIVAKAMARDPNDRYADAGGLARDLEAFSTGRLVAAYRYTSWELVTRFVRRNRALSSAIGALIVVALVGAVAIVRANQTSERERGRAVAAEQRAERQERAAHERLAQVHWQAAVRSLQLGDHLAAEVLAAGALLEHPANPAGPYHALPTDEPLTDPGRARLLSGPSAIWAAARALRFASRERELSAHEDWIYDVLPSADGRWVVTTSADHRAIIWDANDGTVHRTLEGHEGSVFQAALNADGTELATSSYDGTVRVWSFPDGAPRRTLQHPDDRVYGVCYAGDGTLLAAGLSGVLASYDVDSGELVHQADVTSALPWRLHCPRGEAIALMGSSGAEALLVDLETHTVAHRLPHARTFVHCAVLTPDGRDVITGDKEGALRRFDRVTGELRARAQIDGECESMVASRDGRWLAVGAEHITIVDSATLRPVARLDGHAATVVGLAFDHDGHRLYSGGLDHRVIEWRMPSTRESLSLLGGSESTVDSLRVSPDGRRLASGGDDAILRLWDLTSGRIVREIEAHTAPIRGLLFLDDERLVTSGMDLRLRIHRVTDGERRSDIELPHFGDELARVDGSASIVVGSGDGSVLIHDTEAGTLEAIEHVHEERTWWVGFDPAGEMLATASFSGAVALIDPERHAVIRRWSAHDARIYDADWRPDGEELTTGDLSGWVRGWDPATGERLREWRVPEGEEVCSLAWSADAEWLLITTDEGVRVYRPDGTLEARIDLGARATGAAWTSDGRMIFASEGRILLLPLETESWRRDPRALLRDAEAAAGTTLNALIGMQADAPQ